MRYLRSCLIAVVLLPFAACVDVIGDDDAQESTLEADLAKAPSDGGGGGSGQPNVQPTSPP
jgi:hypothetical protein